MNLLSRKVVRTNVRSAAVVSLVQVEVVESIVVVAVVVVIATVDITLVSSDVVVEKVVVDHFSVVVVSIVDVFIVVVASVVDSVVTESSNPIVDPVVSPVVNSDPYSVVVKKAVAYSVVDPGDVSVVSVVSLVIVINEDDIDLVEVDHKSADVTSAVTESSSPVVDSVVGPVVNNADEVDGHAILVDTDIAPSVVSPVVASSVLPITLGVKLLVKTVFWTNLLVFKVIGIISIRFI